MSDGLPQIRVEIDGMRHGIITALSKYHGEVEEAVAQELDHIVNTFDIGAIVRSTVPRELEQWVNSAVSWAISDIFQGIEVRAAIQKAVKNCLVEAAQKEEEDGKEAE